MEFVGSEVRRQYLDDGAAKAAVRRRIFRMVRGDVEPDPTGVGHQTWVPAASANSSYRPPKCVLVLRIPTGDEGIGRCRGKHAKQAGCIENREALIGGNSAPGPMPLQHRMYARAPHELCKIRLFRRAYAAGRSAIIFRFVVVVHPHRAVESRWREYSELRRTGYGPGSHEANPRRGRRQEAGRGRLPDAGSRRRWSPTGPGIAPVICPQFQDCSSSLLSDSGTVEFSFAVSWNGIEIGSILLIEVRYLSRVQGNHHIVGRRRYGRLRHCRNLHVRGHGIRGKWKAADRVHRVINSGLNDRGVHGTGLWRLAAHDGDAVVGHRVPEHNGVRACGRALRIPPNVALGQFGPLSKGQGGGEHGPETSISKHYP